MRNIEVKVINPEVVKQAEDMMVCAARMTQRGHEIRCMDDFMNLYNTPHLPKTAENMYRLPHPTIQKFVVINVAIVGASRRFLAQITRHQNEVKFMSASLQYSDYSDDAMFTVPYEISVAGKVDEYLDACREDLDRYREAAQIVGNDAAGYLMPQGMRNVLIISATPYQWKHMIGQRICNRNTTEMQYVMLRVWEELQKINKLSFAPDVTGAYCQRGKCLEGSMCCGKPLAGTPSKILRERFPLYYED